MPIPPEVAAGAIAGGTELVSNVLNNASTIFANRAGRKYATKMYDRQRQDALSDYAMQNEYNSPAAQMARYKAAGLNPNLIYGQSNEGSTVRSTDAKSWSPEAPKVDLGRVSAAGLGAYYDTRLKALQAEQIAASTKNINQDTSLKLANTALASVQTSRAATDNSMASLKYHQEDSLNENTLEAARLQVERVKTELGAVRQGMQLALNEDERRTAMNKTNISQAVEAIARSRADRAKTADERREIEARIKNLSKDERLKQLDIELKASGLQPGDPAWQRLLMRGLNYLDDKMSSPAGTPVSGNNYFPMP